MAGEGAAGKQKRRAACISVISNTFLTAIKLGAAVATHSVSILSEALHSGLDLAAASMAYLAVCRSQKPADTDHQFGHGKFESISGLAEAVLILLAVVMILWTALMRIVRGHTELSMPMLGLAVMGASTVINVFVSRMLFRVARKTDSVALEADAWHLRTDVWTSAGVFVGLAAIALARRLGFSEADHLDPLIAIGIGVVIARAALGITRQSWDHLVDRALPQEELARIEDLLREHYPQFAEYHRLRTRKSGPHRYVDLHLVVPGARSVAEAHALCDHLEEDLRKLLPRTEVMIHVEPKAADG